MPSRSTLIQRVVFQIQRQLAANARVEEAAFLIDRVTGVTREVDVVVRHQVADHEVVVAVECRDHRRKATVEWVEQMAMKHSALPTSKLVLVSRSGFSRQAMEKARSLGVDAYSFDQTAKGDWRRLLGENAGSPLAIWALRIRGCWLVLAGSEDTAHPAHPNTAIFNADGSVEGQLRQMVYATVEGAPDFTQAALEFAAKRKEPEFLANLGREPAIFVTTEHGLREVALVRVLLEATELPGHFQLHEARFRGNPVAYGEGESPAGKLTISLLQPRDGTATGAASVVDPETGAVSTTDVRFPSTRGKLKFVTGVVRVPPTGSA